MINNIFKFKSKKSASYMQVIEQSIKAIESEIKEKACEKHDEIKSKFRSTLDIAEFIRLQAHKRMGISQQMRCEIDYVKELQVKLEVAIDMLIEQKEMLCA